MGAAAAAVGGIWMSRVEEPAEERLCWGEMDRWGIVGIEREGVAATRAEDGEGVCECRRSWKGGGGAVVVRGLSASEPIYIAGGVGRGAGRGGGRRKAVTTAEVCRVGQHLRCAFWRWGRSWRGGGRGEGGTGGKRTDNKPRWIEMGRTGGRGGRKTKDPPDPGPA